MIYRGSCLCEKIQFEIEAKDPLLFGHCHCRACRKSHGADNTSATIIPSDKLNLLQGEDQLGVYSSSPKLNRQFCVNCGSRLFVRFSSEGENIFYTVAINSLDNVDQWRETAHIFVDHKAPWVSIDDGLPQAANNFPRKNKS